MIVLAAFLLGIAVGAFIWVPGYIRWEESRRMPADWVERQRRNSQR